MRAMKAAVTSQRVTLGIGLAVLLVIGAASIAMDVKSRTDADWVDHTLGVLNKISDLRLLIRRAESASRGFALTRDPSLQKEFDGQRCDLEIDKREVSFGPHAEHVPYRGVPWWRYRELDTCATPRLCARPSRSSPRRVSRYRALVHIPRPYPRQRRQLAYTASLWVQRYN